MKTITLNEKEYELPESWLELEFERFLSFSKLVSNQKTEEDLRKEYKEQGLSDEIIDLQIGVDNMAFNTDIASFWTGLSKDEIAMLSMKEVEDIIKACSFVNEQYNPISLDKFTFNGETYHLPKPGMIGENFGTYIEAEQIEVNNKNIENGNLEVLPKQMAILCKKEGEEKGLVDDLTVEKRAKEFRKIDMATVWDVAFFLLKQESVYMNLILTSMQTQETQKQD
jgi:hypothetical protein